MADVTLVDLVKITASTTGTGAVTLGSPVPGYRGVEALLNGAVYSYAIQQEAEYEVGTGTYLAAGNQFIRTPGVSSDGGTAIDLQPNAAIAFVATAQDILGRDVLRPLYGYGEPFNDTGIVGQTYTDLTVPVTLYGPKTSEGWGNGVVLQGGDGATGAAANTYRSYTALLASDASRRYAYLAGDTDAQPRPDGPYSNPTGVTGAWIPQQADGIIYASDFVPAPTRPVNRVLDDMPTLPSLGVTVDIADNSAKLAEIMAKARDLATQTANPPRIRVPRGIYRYATSPNFGVQGMVLDCEPGAVFLHTGSGSAFVCDGGASGGGICAMRLNGGLIIRGNANTTDAMYQRAVSDSFFDYEAQNFTGAALRTSWTVSNTYRLRCSPVNRPSFNPVPSMGVFLSNRGVGERTSACIFENPIIKGVSGYAFNFNSTIQNTIINGTADSCGGGLYLSDDSGNNVFNGLDIEFCTAIDIFCAGNYNKFNHVLSDHSSSIGGLFNSVAGGLWNELNNTGTYNAFKNMNYATAGGEFSLGDLASVIIDNVRSAQSGTFLPNRNPIPDLLRVLGVDAATALIEGPASLITGGRPQDTDSFKRGGRRILGGPAGPRFTHGDDGTSFYGIAPIQRRTLPAASTDAATTQALTNAMRQYLIDHGQCS